MTQALAHLDAVLCHNASVQVKLASIRNQSWCLRPDLGPFTSKYILHNGMLRYEICLVCTSSAPAASAPLMPIVQPWLPEYMPARSISCSTSRSLAPQAEPAGSKVPVIGAPLDFNLNPFLDYHRHHLEHSLQALDLLNFIWLTKYQPKHVTTAMLQGLYGLGILPQFPRDTVSTQISIIDSP